MGSATLEAPRQRIWEKKTAASRTGVITNFKQLVGEDLALTQSRPTSHTNRRDGLERQGFENGEEGGRGLEEAVDAMGYERENIKEFIQKKREMFLVQMSLDTKREEIRKLDERAMMKEEALKKSEQMLEEDSMRFDTFLKENDRKAHEAIKKAEEETRRKQEKAQEIKRLTQQIQLTSSEMTKHKELLEDCKRYELFLKELTPPEWWQKCREEKAERQERRRREGHEEKMARWQEQVAEIKEKEKKMLEEMEANTKAGKSRRSRKSKKEESAPSPAVRLPLPPRPRLEEEELLSSGEEAPMYFTHPRQLMKIFADLEERNLSLIQNSQEAEKALEDIESTFSVVREEKERKSSHLQETIDGIQAQIEEENLKAQSMRERAAQFGRSSSQSQLSRSRSNASKSKKRSGGSSRKGKEQKEGVEEKEQEELANSVYLKVKEVYESCGFDGSASASTLFMIGQLEQKLEQLLVEVANMPSSFVAKAEKEKEKRRREQKRLEQQIMQQKQQEERNKRAIERSMESPKKRQGRKVMTRSRPIKKSSMRQSDALDQDTLDELRFLNEDDDDDI
jgi:hypothetical protein